MKIVEGLLDKAIGELDKTLAFLGLLLSPILAIWLVVTSGQPMNVAASILTFVACAGYLLIRRNLYLSTIPSIAEMRLSHRLYLVLNILFFLLLSYSILSIRLNPELYTRPLAYFVSTALMTAIVAVEILFLAPHKSHIYFALFKIILIGLSLIWSQMLIFPIVEGVDPWWHRMFTLKILAAGYIPEGYGYSKLPVFHLMAGVTSLITGLNYEMAIVLSVSLLQVVVNTLFVFLLGRLILNTKVGLLAALLVMVASFHIWLGYWAIPTSMGAVLILPVLYLLFKLRKQNPTTTFSLSLLLMATLIITHTLASAWLAIVLFVVWAGFEIYARFYHQKSASPVTLTIVILFSVGMLGFWMHVSGHITSLAKLIGWGFRQEAWLYRPPSEMAIQYALKIPFLENLLNNLGMLLFFALSFIGCFYMVSRRFGNNYGFVVVIGGVVILALGFFAPLVGLQILAGRWFYPAQIMMAIPLGVALVLLCAVFKNELAKVCLMSFLTFTLSFLMIMSPAANLDNHMFSPNTGIRYAFTESELQAVDTILNVWDGPVGTDTYYHLPVVYEFNNEFIIIDDHLLTGDFTDCQDIPVMIRQEIVKSTFKSGGHPLKLDYDPRQVLAEQGARRIYGNGSVSAFVK